MLVEFQDVCVHLHERPVLHDLTLRVSEARVGVIGSNGSGKSTLARLLNGLVRPSRGTVRVDGYDTVQQTREVRRRVGFVFQNPDHQIVLPIVSEDLAFGLKNQGVPRSEHASRVQQVLADMGIEHLAERSALGLSGGEKQLVALAAVLVMRPQLLVFDEPTTLLDLRNRNRLRAILERLEQPVWVVTHDLELLDGYDRVLVLEGGRIVCDAGPREAVQWYRSHCA
mgnify:CR=1 FL=1